MNESVHMRVLGSYLLRDGRFTSGAASVWPDESELGHKISCHHFFITEPYNTGNISTEAISDVV